MSWQSWPIENTWAKGHYVAKITGSDPKYVCGRDFLKGRTSKSRGMVSYAPDDVGTLPAWLVRTPEVRCSECDRPKATEVELLAAWPHGFEVVGSGYTSAELLAIWEMGAPGEPGAYKPEDHCPECGTVSAGGQVCESCEQVVKPDMALPAPF